MSLRRELQGLDGVHVRAAFDGAFDKCESFEETGVMVDLLAADFPALETLISRLQERIAEERSDERSRTHVVLGGLIVLLALADHVRADDMRLQFPDAPTA